MAGDYTIFNCGDCTSQYVATTTASGSAYLPYQTWAGDWTYIDGNTPTVTQIQTIIKDKEVTLDKRTLFKVYVVDPRKNGKVLCDGKLVIAVNENQAMLKAGVVDIADGAGLDLEQVDVYVQTIGTFIRPRKEVQKVKIQEEEE